jgi:uncharacterized protein (DUF1778 family)
MAGKPARESRSMPRATQRKDHPLSMRLPEADIAMIDRAAGLRGRSRTDFVREAAVKAAEDVVMEMALIRMSPAGFAHFMKVISAPAKPVPKLVELFKRKAPWERDGDKR